MSKAEETDPTKIPDHYDLVNRTIQFGPRHNNRVVHYAEKSILDNFLKRKMAGEIKPASYEVLKKRVVKFFRNGKSTATKEPEKTEETPQQPVLRLHHDLANTPITKFEFNDMIDAGTQTDSLPENEVSTSEPKTESSAKQKIVKVKSEVSTEASKPKRPRRNSIGLKYLAEINAFECDKTLWGTDTTARVTRQTYRKASEQSTSNNNKDQKPSTSLQSESLLAASNKPSFVPFELKPEIVDLAKTSTRQSKHAETPPNENLLPKRRKRS